MKREQNFIERFCPQKGAVLFVLGALVLVTGLASCTYLQTRKVALAREKPMVSPPPSPQLQSKTRRQPVMVTPTPTPPSSAPGVPLAAAEEAPAPAPKKVTLPEEKQKRPSMIPAVGSAATETKGKKKEDEVQYIMLNFENAQLPDVVRTMMEILGYNYIIDPRVGGVVNIHTSGKVARGDLFPILETLLKIHNATVVKEGAIYHVRPLGQGQGIVPPVIPRGQTLPGDRLIIQVIPLHFIQADEMAKIIKPFLAPGALLITYDKENLLLVMDFASNIRKFLSMVDLFDIDIFQKVRMKMYFLKFALSQDLVKDMENIFAIYELPKKGARGLGVRFIPIQRINAFLAVSSVPGALELVDRWVKQLDRVSSEDIIRVFVYRCQNQKAEDITKVLKDVYEEKERPKAEKARPAQKLPSRPAGVRPITQVTPGISAPPGTPPPSAAPTVSPAPAKPSGKAPAPPKAPAPSAPPTAEAPPAPETPAAEVAPAGRTEIMADVTGEVTFHEDTVTNSIIVRASERDYRTVLKTIQKLDIYPRQVLIEVVIAEILLDESLKMGFEWQRIGGLGSGSTLGTVTAGFLGGASTVTPGLEYSVVKTGELTAALRAVAAKNMVDILSSPHVIASDNTSASINISDEIPIITGQVTTTDTTAGLEGRRIVDQTIEYRSAGVILTVTPHINDMGLVKMDIQQTVSEVSDKTVAGVDAPVFFNRTAKTTLTVNDSQTIVIGGLIREKKDRVRSGVPFLYKIPVLGFLFGFDSYQINKTELMILITPHVIRGFDDVDIVTREFQNKVKTIKESMKAYK